MSATIVATVTTLGIMGALDALWLTTMAPRLYRREIGDLLLDTPRWPPALAFYVLYAAGALVLVILPAIHEDWGSPRVLLTAAVLGLVAYGTYDLTNLATVRGWSALVTAVDMAWGAALTAVTASAAVLIARAATSA